MSVKSDNPSRPDECSCRKMTSRSAATTVLLIRRANQDSVIVDSQPGNFRPTSPAHLGAEIGLVAVLHTWGQNLHHHPHVHCVVPGGGPSVDRTRWKQARPGFFLPVKVLSRLYRR